MTRQILIIVTRMYAANGGQHDEFVRMWKQRPGLPHRIFNTNSSKIIVLVHGYRGRFQSPDDVPGEVQKAIGSLTITDSDEIGILYHPQPGAFWTLNRNRFTGLGGNIQFVEKYSARSRAVYRAIEGLAQRVAGNSDFTGAFDEVWRFFTISHRLCEFLFRFLPLHLELQLENRSQHLAIDSDTCRGDLSAILESLQVSPTDQQRAMDALNNIFNSIKELNSLSPRNAEEFEEKFKEQFKKFDNAYRALRDHLFSLLERVEASLP
jgi:hypothetical protein